MAGSPWQQVGNGEWKKGGGELNGRATISKMMLSERFNSRRRWKVKNGCEADEEPNQSGLWKGNYSNRGLT